MAASGGTRSGLPRDGGVFFTGLTGAGSGTSVISCDEFFAPGTGTVCSEFCRGFSSVESEGASVVFAEAISSDLRASLFCEKTNNPNTSSNVTKPSITTIKPPALEFDLRR